jgi:hypothetical protein
MTAVDRAILSQLDRATVELARLRALVGREPTETASDDETSAVENLRRLCDARGFRITACGHVSEADAAALLGRSPHTLRGWRSQSRPLACRRFLAASSTAPSKSRASSQNRTSSRI